MTISDSIKYVGVNDHDIDLFEGQYPVPKGMAYNSYVIEDEKIAVMDSVDARFADVWLGNVAAVLGGRNPDYLVVQHMEPDHSGSIFRFVQAYPNVTVVASAKAFVMMKHYFGTEFEDCRVVVGENDTLCLGERTLTFVTAPMVHWPEVIVTYDSKDKVLFSADAFGKFGALDMEEPWEDEARRYYIGIVAKFGGPVQTLLKKAAALDIQTICPLHGPALRENLGHYIKLYDTWSTYAVEEEGVMIAYTSVYGHTEQAVNELAEVLRTKGCPKVAVYDLARCDMTAAVADAFRFGKVVLATTTYNGGIFPFMQTFIHHLTQRGWCRRTVAFVENGSWAPMAARIMKTLLEKSKDLTYIDNDVTVTCAMSEANAAQLAALADALCSAQ